MFGEEYRSDIVVTRAASPNSQSSKTIPPSKSNNTPRAANNNNNNNAASSAGARNVLNSGRMDEDHHQLKSVAEIIKELDADRDMSGPKSGYCSRFFIPFVVAAVTLIIFVATIWTSGSGVDVTASPRVALIVIEGFKGTVFEELLQSELHLPNIATMMNRHGGVHAACPSHVASSCARTVVVEDDATGTIYTSSGSSIASMLSGVSPRKHKVRKDSLTSYANYASSSKEFPSVAKRVMDAGKRVAVFATSHLINSFGYLSGRCLEAGVLDMECAGSTAEVLAEIENPMSVTGTPLECLSAKTCNIATRKMKLPTNPSRYSDGVGEVQFTRQLREVFGGLEITHPEQKNAVQNIIADNLDDSLFIFHFDALAVRAASEALPDFTLSAESKPYVAQAYLIDALVGQVLAFVRDRSYTQKENWLVMGVSDVAGVSKGATGEQVAVAETQVIPFFMASYTSSVKRFTVLRQMHSPVSTLDVLPTALRWLNLPPFDDVTQSVVDGKNISALGELVDARLKDRALLEGQVQGICTSGMFPVDCQE